jgi:hypothetical protein
VTIGEAVWDVFVFRYLLLRYLASKVSVAGQVLIVEVTSMTSIQTPVETLDLRSGYIDARLRCALAEGGGSKFGFRDENPEIGLGLDLSSSVHVQRFLLEGLA